MSGPPHCLSYVTLRDTRAGHFELIQIRCRRDVGHEGQHETTQTSGATTVFFHWVGPRARLD
jgi:hypothetical protein